MRTTVLLTFFAFLVSCGTRESTDAPLAIGDPTAYGLDPEEITAIEDHIQWAIDSSYISGAVAVIAIDDKIIYEKAIGFSDRAKTKRMSTDNIFRLASMTKPVTTTAVMQLVEQGRISVDDPVSKYIPAFAETQVLETYDESDSSFTTVPRKRDITIHHLLTHTSGIPYSLFHPVAAIVYPQFGITEAWTTQSVTLETNIPKQAQAPLMHQPGEKWTYGTNIDVLGYIVEIVSGMPLDNYIEQHILQLLKIEDMGFYLPDEKADRLVEVWFTSDVDENAQSSIPTNYPVEGAKSYFAGGAGLVGTARDYLKFASALLNGGTLGEARILEPSTVEMMFTNQIDTVSYGEGQGFGYGGSVRLQENEAGLNPGHWGWDGYWQTLFRIDPQNDMVMILLTNAFTTPRWNDVLGGYERLVVQSVED